MLQCVRTCSWAGWVWDGEDVVEHGGTQRDLNRLKCSVGLDRNQGAWPGPEPARALEAGLRLYRRELSGVEQEVPASREVGSVRGRKSTELPVMAALSGSTLDQLVAPPLPCLRSRKQCLESHDRAGSCTNANHGSYCSSDVRSMERGDAARIP